MRLILVVLALAASGPLSAQEAAAPAANASRTVGERLTTAKAQVDNLDYISALDELNDVISDAEATEDELIEAHVYAGIVSRIVGNDVDARLHFSWVLKRRPDMSLPANQPPKVAILYDMVRDELERSPEANVGLTPSASANGEAEQQRPETTPETTPSVTTEEPNESVPWIMVGGGIIAAVGAIAVVAGAASWGAGLVMFNVGNNDNVQVSALQWSTPSVVAQVAGQILAAVGIVGIIGGAVTAAAGFLVE